MSAGTGGFAAVAYMPRENRILLRIEGAALALAALYVFATLDVSWWIFAALILAPDLGALGYLRSPALGSRTYNITHLWVWPVALVLAGFLMLRADPGASQLVLAIGLIWAVHIGGDRALGYGLKYPGAFDRTHLGPIGRAARS
jgi:hypothetical protein